MVDSLSNFCILEKASHYCSQMDGFSWMGAACLEQRNGWFKSSVGEKQIKQLPHPKKPKKSWHISFSSPTSVIHILPSPHTDIHLDAYEYER